LPEIDFKELKEEMKRNKKQRREFVKQYAEWLKKTPNKVWSKQHVKFLND
jgi:hypothetical protein